LQYNVLMGNITLKNYLVIVLVLTLIDNMQHLISFGYSSDFNGMFLLSLLIISSVGLNLLKATQFAISFVLIALSLNLLQTTYEILSIPGSQLDLFGLDFGLYVFELLFYGAVYSFGLYLINKSRQAEKLQQVI
jgi:hypothetical protein